ncbi:MAG: Fatty acid metabolism regulator protein [Phycisphaerae bacterium]|nr:Fatty acid metabolism regulator protein [Phycisphaerae bacterium]
MAALKMDTRSRRRQITQAALGLLAEQGFRGLSMSAVARRVGLVPSAIYRHFSGKDALLDEIPDLIREKLHGHVAAVCEQIADAMGRLEQLAAIHAEMLKENQVVPRLLFAEDFYIGHPERKERIYAVVRGYLSRLGELFADAQRAGQVRRNLEPALLATMFLGVFQPAAVLWFASGGHFDAVGHTRKAWKLYRDAIATK